MTPASVMHDKAMYYRHTESVVYSTFADYAQQLLQSFKGESDTPRVVCGQVTREYMVIPVRSHREEDVDEAPELVKLLRNNGYYAQLLGTQGAMQYTSIAVMVCWDPDIVEAKAAEDALVDASSFNLYNIIMSYVKAERMLSSLPTDAKVKMVFNGVPTTSWVCLSILTQESYNEIPVVGRYLWNQGYRIGVEESTRRPGTWVLFVSWDPEVVASMPECTGDFRFHGQVPGNWS